MDLYFGLAGNNVDLHFIADGKFASGSLEIGPMIVWHNLNAFKHFQSIFSLSLCVLDF